MTLHCSLPAALLPATDALQPEGIAIAPDQITATLVAIQPVGSRPLCGGRSRRIHSHYPRTLTDLAWGALRVCLELTVREFFCNDPACARRIFTERLPDVAAPYARRTTRLADLLRLLAFALGGATGSRVLTRLRTPVSAATLLRLIRRTPLDAQPTPRVLGVDEARGTHRGTPSLDAILGGGLAGIAPTGKAMCVQNVHIFRLRDGRIAEHWATRDDLGMLRQLGLLGTPTR